MGEDRVDGLPVTVDDREDAVGEPGLLPQPGQEQPGGWVLLARLEYERVAARDRGRAHPQRHHGREVERRDAGDHAERLADRVHVDAGRCLLRIPALEQVRDARRELGVLQPARHLTPRIGEHLAVLARDHGGQLVGTLGQQFPEREQHGRPSRQ
jgi:hypothetical protein